MSVSQDNAFFSFSDFCAHRHMSETRKELGNFTEWKNVCHE